MFEEHLLGGLFVHFNGFFRIFPVTSQFCQEAEFPCRTHQNSTRRSRNKENRSKIYSQIFLQNTFLCVIKLSRSKSSDRSAGVKMPSRRRKQVISLRNSHPAGGIVVQPAEQSTSRRSSQLAGGAVNQPAEQSTSRRNSLPVGRVVVQPVEQSSWEKQLFGYAILVLNLLSYLLITFLKSCTFDACNRQRQWR